MADNKLIPLIKALGQPSAADITAAVNDWLDDHPEATTTVEDGSITKAKLDSSLQGTVDDVADLKSALGDVEHFASNQEKYLFSGFDTSSAAVAGTDGGKTFLDMSAGYIQRSNGAVGGTTSSWKHSDFIAISDISGATGNFVTHSSVANIAYYSSQSLSTYLGHYDAMGAISLSTLTTNAPSGAKYVILSTDSTNSNKLYAYLYKKFPETLTTIKQTMMQQKRLLHISFDDTNFAFEDLTDNASEYTSIFDSPFFGALKSLHDAYGAVFSCYCFSEYTYTKNSESHTFSLDDCTTAFAEEFAANKDWLKFGFHSASSSTNYGSATSAQAEEDYEAFVDQIKAITGTRDCIDTVVRLQNYAGSADAVTAMRDAKCGVTGFLCYDTTDAGASTGYALTNAQAIIVGKRGEYFDPDTQLFYFATNTRLDNYIGYVAEYGTYIVTYLNSLLTDARYTRNHIQIFYAHQDQMFRPTGGLNTDYVTRLVKLCQWAIENKYTFGFPMDKINAAY